MWQVFLIFIVLSALLVGLFYYFIYEKYTTATLSVKDEDKFSSLFNTWNILLFDKGFHNELDKKIKIILYPKSNTFKIKNFYSKYVLKGKYTLENGGNQINLLSGNSDNVVCGKIEMKPEIHLTIEDTLGNTVLFKQPPNSNKEEIITKTYDFYVY
jgi:hypothetical protein